MKKQLIAKLLVLALVLTMVPVTILAASAQETANNDAYYDVSEDSSVRVDEAVGEDGVIEAKVINGTATVVMTEKAVASLADLVKDGKIELEIKDEGASVLSWSAPVKALSAVAAETGADVVINSTVATISIPNEVLTNELGDTGTLKITAQSSESSVGFTIQVSGRALKGVKGIQVTF